MTADGDPSPLNSRVTAPIERMCNDPYCPCQEGLICHYVYDRVTKTDGFPRALAL